MIYNAQWREEFHRFVLPRLSVAHPDLTRIAGLLRDAGVDVWTELPSDRDRLTANRQAYSLEGWRTHYKQEFARLQQWRAAHGGALQGYDAQALVALDGYLGSLPAIGQAFAAVVAAYTDSEGRLLQARITQAERDTLAAVIEAELQ